MLGSFSACFTVAVDDDDAADDDFADEGGGLDGVLNNPGLREPGFESEDIVLLSNAVF